MAFDHLFWAYKRLAHACGLKGLQGVKKLYRLHEGVPLLDGFPEDARYEMNPEFPDQTLIGDQVKNVSAHILVSQRVELFLRAKNLPSVEFLPATIIDHRGRRAPSSFFIVNPPGALDILDLDACQVTRDYADNISMFARFVVKPEACSDLPPLFRIAGMSRYLLVHRELAAQLLAQGFTGCAFLEPETLAGVDLPPDLRLLVPH